MCKTLLELKNDILTGKHTTAEEWKRLDDEVNAAMKMASEEEIEEFVDSGAGEMLDMICSGFAYESDRK